MNTALTYGNTYIKESPIHGFGVFASKDILQGNLIEESPYLFFEADVAGLQDYLFTLNEEYYLPLGSGVIYNHADQPNAKCIFDRDRMVAEYVALNDIKKDEEIFLDYGKNWFKVRDIQPKKASFWFRLTKLAHRLKMGIRFALLTTGLVGLIWLINHSTM